MKHPLLQNLFTVTLFSSSYGQALPNKWLVVAALKPFEELNDASLSVFTAIK